MMRLRAIAILLLAAVSVWAAPLLGLALTGLPISDYLQIPPRTQFVPHRSFDWRVFAILSVPIAGAAALVWIALARGRPAMPARSQRRLPWWAWLGFSLVACGWWLAWHDGVLPAEWRRHVFTPLWGGYVLAMNGLAFRNTGRALLTHRTRWFLALFPASMGFWWLFEYLNQFTGNWYYAGIEPGNGWDYFVQATLPFSTVLPAVASTWAWLGRLPRFEAMTLPALRAHRTLAWVVPAAGVAALVFIGIAPETLYPALWIAPLLILWGLQKLVLGETVLTPLRHGDWRPLLQPALAALVCGFLWELWNVGSLAKWHYSIPYVQRFSLFEMPLLGYGGYLPFGIECALVMDLVARCVERRALWPLDQGSGPPT
jgi:hypothetical protein